jgi:hypothetical protein
MGRNLGRARAAWQKSSMANLEEPSDGQGQRGYVARMANVITTALAGGVVAVSAAMDYADDGLMNLSFADLDGNGAVGDINGDGTTSMAEMVALAAAAMVTARMARTGARYVAERSPWRKYPVREANPHAPGAQRFVQNQDKKK